MLVQADLEPWPWVDPKFWRWKIAIRILSLERVPIVHNVGFNRIDWRLEWHEMINIGRGTVYIVNVFRRE